MIGTLLVINDYGSACSNCEDYYVKYTFCDYLFFKTSYGKQTFVILLTVINPVHDLSGIVQNVTEHISFTVQKMIVLQS